MPWPQPAPPAAGTSPSLPRCVGSRRLIPISSGSCGCSIPAAISWDRRSRSMAEPTIGLVGVGGYVPPYPLFGKALAQGWGGGARGGGARAHHHQGALTTATQAAPHPHAG